MIDDLVDFFAVDRIRQGDTHVAVAKGFSQGGFWGVPVEVVCRTAIWTGDPQFEFALFFFGSQRGKHVDTRVAAKQVEFAVDKFEQDNLGILDDGKFDAVCIGQLIARCVNFPVVGVAFIDDALTANPFDGDPGG